MRKLFLFFLSFFGKRRYSHLNFEIDSSGELRCKDCKKVVTLATVAHEKKGFDDGGPRYLYEKEYFCSNCDEVPSPVGKPIYID